ncbi:Lipopolysaccharide export system ATP-binding protein LptB (plasmid) [Sulfitobacter sp. DSM 110093]|uniref:ABC transporter ATP-binding protein n=1 Tax=Sulfitobacter sp. DSM 110093 TaxID=2883127 RepID=UPI001FAC40D4|nr:ABC transporter ATP-binding protein [Sulfitobacter sp. DSM 110093]UOA33787.1 Lipopolysaccharide export system ATP-binding protein LptB [Sulfitobacter sp. DSM 110093]UOA34048.1 Lipopolysaccharide export system ATP-binding protein LptB [Sulfitobacter sp. DSM 110093]
MSQLNVRKLSKRFGGVQALSNVSFTVGKGDLVGLIGPNGAGKTTAFNVLTGVMAASSGSIEFEGKDITRLSPEVRANLGMTRTFQNIRLFDDMTVRQNVMAGAHARAGRSLMHSVFGLPGHRAAEQRIGEIADEMLERTGLTEFGSRNASELSYGDRRRVEIARALASAPTLLLLDEPAAGMTDTEKGRLSQLVRRLNDDGLTIILVEHNVRMVAALCKRLIVVNKGEMLALGKVDEVLRMPEVAAVYLGRRRKEIL